MYVVINKNRHSGNSIKGKSGGCLNGEISSIVETTCFQPSDRLSLECLFSGHLPRDHSKPLPLPNENGFSSSRNGQRLDVHSVSINVPMPL